MPDEPEPTPTPEPEPEPPEPTPEPEPVIEQHKEESIVTWTRGEKEKLFNTLSEIGESLNGKKKENPDPDPAPTGDTKPAPARKRGLRFKSKRK